MGGIIWEGEGIEEIGIRKDNDNIVIKIDPQYFRPTEVNSLLGDARKANEKLGWKSITSLEELVSDMINYDLKNASKKALLISKGYS